MESRSVKIKDSQLDLLSKFRLARFCYRNGITYWTDMEYDKTLRLLQQLIPQNRYVLTSYDDDDVPYEILEQAGFTEDDVAYYANQVRVAYEPEEETELRERIQEKQSKSIKPAFTWEECYEQFEAVAGIELCVSPKIDGCMGKSLFVKQEDSGLYKFKLAVTKSRDATSLPINITRNMSRIVPASFDGKLYDEETGELQELPTDILVTGEYFCDESSVPVINAKYGVDLVNGRTAGLSMMRTESYMTDDYKYMDFMVHSINLGKTLYEGLQFAEDMGFTVVPRLLYTYDNMDFEEFKIEISKLAGKIKEIADAAGLLTDGAVVEINDREEFKNLISETMYDKGNFAIKVGEWLPDVYTTTLLEVIKTQKADRISFKGRLEPVYTKSGIKQELVTLWNPDFIIQNKLTIGCKVCIMYKNNTTPLFICNAEDEQHMQQVLSEIQANGGTYGYDYDDEDEEDADDGE